MGSVWLAERADGRFKRQVALKLPRLAWGAGLSERMAREREIGMLLEHPAIARLYDAGLDDRGRPYLEIALQTEGPQSRTAIDLRVDRANDLLRVTRFEEAQPFIDSALSSLRLSGEAGQLRAAVVAARYWAYLAKLNLVSLSEAVAVIEMSRTDIAALGPGTPRSIQAEVDFLLGATYADRGYLTEAEPLMSDNVSLLWDSMDSLRKRIPIINSAAHLQLYLGRHSAAEALFLEELDLKQKLGEAHLAKTAMVWFFASWSIVMQRDYDRAETFLSKAPKFVANPADQQGYYHARAVQEAGAVIRLERGDAAGAKAMMPNASVMTPSNRHLNPWEPALFGEVDCASGQPKTGLPLLSDAIRRIEELMNTNEPELNRLRATAGLCALATGNRAQALRLAELARRAFTAQPGVSPYFKAPLRKLEQALGLRGTET